MASAYLAMEMDDEESSVGTASGLERASEEAVESIFFDVQSGNRCVQGALAPLRQRKGMAKSTNAMEASDAECCTETKADRKDEVAEQVSKGAIYGFCAGNDTPTYGELAKYLHRSARGAYTPGSSYNRSMARMMTGGGGRWENDCFGVCILYPLYDRYKDENGKSDVTVTSTIHIGMMRWITALPAFHADTIFSKSTITVEI